MKVSTPVVVFCAHSAGKELAPVLIASLIFELTKRGSADHPSLSIVKTNVVVNTIATVITAKLEQTSVLSELLAVISYDFLFSRWTAVDVILRS